MESNFFKDRGSCKRGTGRGRNKGVDFFKSSSDAAGSLVVVFLCVNEKYFEMFFFEKK